MTGGGPTRRELLRAGGALAAVGAISGLGGCGGLFGGDGPTGDVSALQYTPQAALVAVDVDVDALLGDAVLRRALDANLEIARAVSDRVPASTAAGFDRVQSRTGLDPRAVHRVVGFGGRRPNPEPSGSGVDPLVGGYWGTIAWTDWSPAAVREAMETLWEPITTRRAGDRTVLQVPAGEVALFSDGRLVAGQRPGIDAVLNRSPGRSEGQLATALGAARPGHVRFGLAPRSGDEGDGAFTDPIALLAGKIDYVHGSIYADGDRRGLVFTFATGSGADAEDVHEAVDSFLALARSGQFGGRYQALLAPLTTERDGTEVLASYEASADGFAATLLTVATAIALDD